MILEKTYLNVCFRLLHSYRSMCCSVHFKMWFKTLWLVFYFSQNGGGGINVTESRKWGLFPRWGKEVQIPGFHFNGPQHWYYLNNNTTKDNLTLDYCSQQNVNFWRNPVIIVSQKPGPCSALHTRRGAVMQEASFFNYLKQHLKLYFEWSNMLFYWCRPSDMLGCNSGVYDNLSQNMIILSCWYILQHFPSGSTAFTSHICIYRNLLK